MGNRTRTFTKLLPALLLASVGLTGCATSKQADQTNEQLHQVNQGLVNISAQLAALEAKANRPAPAPARGCLLGGQIYSPGAVVAGRICEDTRGIRISDQPPVYGWGLHTNPRR